MVGLLFAGPAAGDFDADRLGMLFVGVEARVSGGDGTVYGTRCGMEFRGGTMYGTRYGTGYGTRYGSKCRRVRIGKKVAR